MILEENYEQAMKYGKNLFFKYYEKEKRKF